MSPSIAALVSSTLYNTGTTVYTSPTLHNTHIYKHGTCIHSSHFQALLCWASISKHMQFTCAMQHDLHVHNWQLAHCQSQNILQYSLLQLTTTFHHNISSSPNLKNQQVVKQKLSLPTYTAGCACYLYTVSTHTNCSSMDYIARTRVVMKEGEVPF